MRKTNLFLQYSIVAVAALALAACGSDRTAGNSADRSMDAARDTGAGSMADRTATGGYSAGDRSFIEDTMKGGMSEVEMAKLVQQKASNPRVKELGRQLEADHMKANEELRSIAANANVTVAGELDRSHIDDLSNKSGVEFDKEFLKRTIDDHKENIERFEKVAGEGRDPALKQFAGNTLPNLRKHLATAEKLYGGREEKPRTY